MRRAGAISALLLWALGALPAGGAAATWEKKSFGSGGEYNALAMDASGNPHLSHLVRKPERLEHRWFDGKKWQREPVEADAGWWSAIAVDAGGSVHLVYTAERQGSVLRYGWKDAYGWHLEDLDALGGQSASIALDAGGQPHVSYVGQGGEVRVARLRAGVWEIETVAPAGVWFEGTSIAVGPEGEDFVAYVNRSVVDSVNFARKEGDAWVTEVVGEGTFPSLRRDEEGNLHLVYASDDALYAVNRGHGWEVETILSREELEQMLQQSGVPGTQVRTDRTALALDQSGRPRVALSFTVTAGEGWAEGLAWGTRDESSWSGEILAGGRIGFETSIVLDAKGLPTVLARQAGSGENSQLRYYRMKPAKLSVSLKNGRFGSVTSVPSGISCGKECSEEFLPGTAVTLTAAPNSGKQFLKWTGACSGTEPSCTVTVGGSKKVTATFSR